MDTWQLIVVEESVAIKEYMLSHFQELFEDMEVYVWKTMREYHDAWLQLLEQGQAAWIDDVEKAQLRRLTVWRKASLNSKVSSTVTTTAPSPNPKESEAVMNTSVIHLHFYSIRTVILLQYTEL